MLQYWVVNVCLMQLMHCPVLLIFQVARVIQPSFASGYYEFNCIGNRAKDTVYFMRLDSEWWRYGDDVAGIAHMHAHLIAFKEGSERHGTWFSGNRLELNASHQPDIADVFHHGQAFQRMGCRFQPATQACRTVFQF